MPTERNLLVSPPSMIYGFWFRRAWQLPAGQHALFLPSVRFFVLCFLAWLERVDGGVRAAVSVRVLVDGDARWQNRIPVESG